MTPIHTTHIPVMGTGFTIDTPIKVAKYGISSVISLVDDALVEDMRQYYCNLENKNFEPISKYEDDYRAKRFTAYLNLVDEIVKKQFEKVKNSCFEIGSEITKYFEMLSNSSSLKKLYQEMLQSDDTALKEKLQTRLRSLMSPGNIDVNIMTKLDRDVFAKDKAPLPQEFSDALAALRGFAQSTLNSAIVFSAGINRRLYSYVEQFEDFYADKSGYIKKKIILKVSDYRSSIIQGRFFAKKGLWISEYRIESGLNCGGHAFASDGYLMGPILEEFKKKKSELISSLYSVYTKALETKKRLSFKESPEVKITAQGGIGTSKENNFLLGYFNLNGTGWATPFLLVPEVTNVDLTTLDKLAKATEKELFLSGISPLGVPFNNLKDNLSDTEKMRRFNIDRPGSACPLGHLVSNTEFTEEKICTASRQYQKLKIEELDALRLNKEKYTEEIAKIVDKACICSDLASGVLIKYKLEKKGVKRFTSVCPGPNLAYFSKITTLPDMLGHIYGRINLLNDTYRPNMFIKELKMYVNYFKKEVLKIGEEPTDKNIKYFNEFKNNMIDGINYYTELFPKMLEETQEYHQKTLDELSAFHTNILDFLLEHKNIFNGTTSEAV